jgi:hypothetical protein
VILEIRSGEPERPERARDPIARMIANDHDWRLAAALDNLERRRLVGL